MAREVEEELVASESKTAIFAAIIGNSDITRSFFGAESFNEDDNTA
jgi:hypothetical protein